MGTKKIFTLVAEEENDGIYEFTAAQGARTLTMAPLSSRLAKPHTTMNPVELMLSGIAGCIGITLRQRADATGVSIDKIRICIEGERPADATRSGIHDISIKIEAECSCSEEELLALAEESKKMCTVCDTMAHKPLYNLSVIKKS